MIILVIGIYEILVSEAIRLWIQVKTLNNYHSLRNNMEHVEIIKKYENYLLYAKQTSTNTVLAYVSDAKNYVEFCEIIQYSVLEMNSLLIENYLSKLHDEKKGTSINRTVSALNSFYEYLSMTYKIVNPMEKIEFHHHKAPLPKTLYIHDIMTLLDSFSSSERDMFHKMIVY